MECAHAPSKWVPRRRWRARGVACKYVRASNIRSLSWKIFSWRSINVAWQHEVKSRVVHEALMRHTRALRIRLTSPELRRLRASGARTHKKNVRVNIAYLAHSHLLKYELCTFRRLSQDEKAADWYCRWGRPGPSREQRFLPTNSCQKSWISRSCSHFGRNLMPDGVPKRLEHLMILQNGGPVRELSKLSLEIS